MQNEKKPFIPEFVDEQVELLGRSNKIQCTSTDVPEIRLVRDLSSLYQECAGTRDRVWQRLEWRMQQQTLLRSPGGSKPMTNERKSPMVQRDSAGRSAVRYYATLIASIVVAAVLVGSMALIFSTMSNPRGTSVGGQHSISTASTKPPSSTSPSPCPYASPSSKGEWRDAPEEAICLNGQETPLHISRTVANHQVDFVAAYADSNRLVLLYIEHISPTADAVSFTGLTLQGGIKLSGGASQSYGDLQGQRLYVQVTFDTTSLPADTTTLHVQSIGDMMGETIQLGFALPFHGTHQ